MFMDNTPMFVYALLSETFRAFVKWFLTFIVYAVYSVFLYNG